MRPVGAAICVTGCAAAGIQGHKSLIGRGATPKGPVGDEPTDIELVRNYAAGSQPELLLGTTPEHRVVKTTSGEDTKHHQGVQA